MTNSRIVYGILLAVIVGGMAVFGVMILDRTGDVVGTADRFMGAIVQEREGDAWSLLAPETRRRFGTAERMTASLAGEGTRVTGWSYGRKRVTDNYATFPLRLTWSDGTTSKGAIHLQRLNGEWLVTGVVGKE